MSKKAGIELSLGFIIFLILGLIVFTGMLALANKFFAKTNEIQANLDSQTDAQIENLLDTGEKVIIPVTRKVGNKGDVLVFGLGIRNDLGREELFGVRVKCNPVGGACDNSWIQMFDGNTPTGGPLAGWVVIKKGTRFGIDIDNNDKVKIPIGIKVPNTAASDTTYVFDVEVWNDACEEDQSDPCHNNPYEVIDQKYSPPLKLYVEAP